ncbi:Glycosyl transferase, family 14 [Artemisia annua]|uniref:Glycosyl transferase, family 14 n=1 Tax=Artemisia annua TaxID=35608 RepID=A0A2U1MMJ4_ARTAN|nr:Glycosyl transferase, family 14 [Artemisia annua]
MTGKKRFASKSVIFLLILICIVVIVGLLSQFKLQSSSTEFSYYNHHDNLLEYPIKDNKKIAFLFLVRDNLPLDFLWHNFFKNADPENFTIYIHSKPGILFDKSVTKSAFFYNRQLRNSVEVGWGTPTMIEAEKLLFKAALDDPRNQIFVLLSDSCVPLYNFSYIYKYLISSPRSFVDSFIDATDDPREKRYNPEMSPDIPEDKWRKGSQWITLVRRHAEVVAYDHDVFPIFEKHCKRRPLLDLSKGNESLIEQQQHNCIPDEHYVPTLLAMRGYEVELERRTLTYSLWNQSTEPMNTQAWHPVTFGFSSASQKNIQDIKDIDHVYFKFENRTEWCGTRSSSGPCYLFARKFSRGAAMRLLTNGVVGPYDPSTLFLDPT